MLKKRVALVKGDEFGESVVSQVGWGVTDVLICSSVGKYMGYEGRTLVNREVIWVEGNLICGD